MSNDLEYLRHYVPLIDEIKDEELRRKVASVYVKIWRESAWKHMDEVSLTPEIQVSQMEHLNAVCESAIALVEILNRRHGTKVNKDYVVASVILHDSSKYAEYKEEDGRETRNDFGKFIQHGFLSAMVALESGIPLEVVHAIVAHTPQSNVLPQTLEAIIVYFADAVDYNFLRIRQGMPPDLRK